jgi:hypothetical protein
MGKLRNGQYNSKLVTFAVTGLPFGGARRSILYVSWYLKVISYSRHVLYYVLIEICLSFQVLVQIHWK